MNEIVKASVDARRNALFTSFDIKDEGAINQIDEYFKRLEEFAKNYNDPTEFETAFASSPLAKEYTDLFVMVTNLQASADMSASAKDEMIDDATRFARRRARQEAYDVARDIPGVGEALSVKQQADFLGMFRRKKDD